MVPVWACEARVKCHGSELNCPKFELDLIYSDLIALYEQIFSVALKISFSNVTSILNIFSLGQILITDENHEKVMYLLG